MKTHLNITLLIALFTCLFVSCDNGIIEDEQSANSPTTSELNAFGGEALSKSTHEEKEVHYQNMVNTVHNMSVSQINSMSDDELLALGTPLRNMTSETIQLSEESLEQLDDLIHQLIENARNQNKEAYEQISERITKIITPYPGFEHEKRDLGPDKIREVFLEIKAKQGAMSTIESIIYDPSIYGVEISTVSDGDFSDANLISRSEYDAMMVRLKAMNPFEIRILSDQEVLELGRPLQMMINSTIKLSDDIIDKLKSPIDGLYKSAKAQDKVAYERWSKEVNNVLEPYPGLELPKRNIGVNELREIFLDINSEYELLSTCSTTFDEVGGEIIITPSHSSLTDGGLGFANTVCPSSSHFVITSGTHTNSYVFESNTGNEWIGVSGAIVDGQDSDNILFDDGLNYNYISGFKIQDYDHFGIRSRLNGGSTGVTIYNMEFENIGAGLSGQDYGAILFEYSDNITVSYSYFEDVTSAIRYKNSTGSLQVIGNEGLNTGRNFFQCSTCSGSNIKINDNSMDRTSSFGSVPLEDWISLFETYGQSGSWVQVNGNRARGHSSSDSGSFIMLGDYGGQYQEAKNNIGVSPGAVGIGIAGGEDMLVEGNYMFNDPWSESNVGYYSADYSPGTCDDHDITGNYANWMNDNEYPDPNNWWTDGNCSTMDVAYLNSNNTYDSDMDEDIWNEW